MHVVANPAPTALQMKLQLKENIQNSQLSAKKEKVENKYFGLTNTPNDSRPRNNFNQNQSSSKKTSFSSGTDTPAFRGNRTLDNENISQPGSSTQAFTTKIELSGIQKIDNEEQKVMDELKDIDLKISSRLKQSQASLTASMSNEIQEEMPPAPKQMAP